MINKYIIIDPCYLDPTDTEWTNYCNRMIKENNIIFKQGEIVDVFRNLKGVYVDNGFGDIGWNQMEISLAKGKLVQNLPPCDAGHHIIFNQKDIENIKYENIFTSFESVLTLEELSKGINVFEKENEPLDKGRG